MCRKLFLASLCALALAACQKRAATEQGSAQTKLDACELIKKEEIQALQGSAITDTKGSGNADQGFRMSQCFYTAAEATKSVSLVVTQRDPNAPGKRGPKDFWKETFGSYRGEEGDKEKRESREETRGRHEEEEAAPPRKISGIGDDAFWIGSPVGGALYVLKKDTFIRISVGGPDNEQNKIDKSKALAAKALERL